MFFWIRWFQMQFQKCTGKNLFSVPGCLPSLELPESLGSPAPRTLRIPETSVSPRHLPQRVPSVSSCPGSKLPSDVPKLSNWDVSQLSKPFWQMDWCQAQNFSQTTVPRVPTNCARVALHILLVLQASYSPFSTACTPTLTLAGQESGVRMGYTTSSTSRASFENPCPDSSSKYWVFFFHPPVSFFRTRYTCLLIWQSPYLLAHYISAPACPFQLLLLVSW